LNGEEKRGVGVMDCYNCGNPLIWGGDHDHEGSEDYCIETNLSCPVCGAFVLVYWGKDGEKACPRKEAEAGEALLVQRLEISDRDKLTDRPRKFTEVVRRYYELGPRE
jgi:hypothetical protein